MTRKSDAQARARIIATRGALKADRMAGFRQTGSALDAIYGNLATTTRGIAASQTVANARTMAALERISGRAAKRATGIARSTGKAERNAYGSVAGAAADRQSHGLEAAAKASALTLKGEVGAGKVGVKGAADVLGIISAGAQEAKAGAAGQLADALAYRARQDAQVIAGMQQARMQANLEFQNWKRQQDYLRKLEEKDASGKLQGVGTYADEMTRASSGMRVLLENGDYTNPDQLVTDYTTQNGQPLDDNEKAALNVLARQLMTNHVYGGQGDRQDEVDAVMRSMHVLYPSWSGQRDRIQKAVTGGLNAVYAGATADAAEQRANWLDSHPEGNVAYQRDAALANVLTDSSRTDSIDQMRNNRSAAIQRAVQLGMDPRVAESYVDMLLNTVSEEDLIRYSNTYEPDQVVNFGESPA